MASDEDCRDCTLKARVEELEVETKSQAVTIDTLYGSVETLTTAINKLSQQVMPIANVYTRIEGFFSTSSWIGSVLKNVAAALIAIGVIAILVIEALKVYAAKGPG